MERNESIMSTTFCTPQLEHPPVHLQNEDEAFLQAMHDPLKRALVIDELSNVERAALLLFRQLDNQQITTYLCDLQARANKIAPGPVPPAKAFETT